MKSSGLTRAFTTAQSRSRNISRHSVLIVSPAA